MLNLLFVGLVLTTTIAVANPAGREVTYQIAQSDREVIVPFTVPDVCKLAQDVGNGDQKLKRWFFNNDEAACKQFTYKGEKGNDNRYMTEEECINKCTENPCPSKLYAEKDGHRTSCDFNSSTHMDSCPINAFCLLPQKVCCMKDPEVTDLCTQPMEEGREDVHEISNPSTKWFYNSTANDCQKFMYKGIGGNQNQFDDKIVCRKTCKLPNVCPNNSRPFSSAHGPVICAKDSDCPGDHFVCHKYVCCPEPRKLPVDFGVSEKQRPANTASSQHAFGLLTLLLFLSIV
ncbi:hypothetical protein M3Y95_00417600 [Aphelenchoides besseyi]|nr:hypothetical protein M3Y95_00417600 [Aphelenchoides besseyi]